MSQIATPIICVIIGEGGSAGHWYRHRQQSQHARARLLPVISPEGCAGILWKEAKEQTKPMAASALRLTSKDLFRLKVIDDVIPTAGGAHRDHDEMGNTLKTSFRYLRAAAKLSPEELLQQRYEIPLHGRVRGAAGERHGGVFAVLGPGFARTAILRIFPGFQAISGGPQRRGAIKHKSHYRTL